MKRILYPALGVFGLFSLFVFCAPPAYAEWTGTTVIERTSIGGEKSLGNQLAEQMKLVATDVTVVVLKNTGHWILEERPKETTDALVKFL